MGRATVSAMRIFLAGAGGVIGRRLMPMLAAAGHDVTGTTRSPERGEAIRAAGGTPVVVDVYDRDALIEAVVVARPEVIIHQLTDLTKPSGKPLSEAELRRNARIREEGTANLVAAAHAAGAGRFVAQSVAWLYAPGGEPHGEDDPLEPLTPAAPPLLRGAYSLESQVTTDSAFEGLVLRYGRLYGEGTWDALPPEPPTVHADAAARAASLAVDHGLPGIYNVVDDGGPVDNAKARAELSWAP